MVEKQYKQTPLNSGCNFENIGIDDISQEEIVKNANTIMPRVADNFSGDDKAKIRGLTENLW